MRTGARVAPWRPATGARIPSADVTGAPCLADCLLVVAAARTRERETHTHIYRGKGKRKRRNN